MGCCKDTGDRQDCQWGFLEPAAAGASYPTLTATQLLASVQAPGRVALKAALPVWLWPLVKGFLPVIIKIVMDLILAKLQSTPGVGCPVAIDPGYLPDAEAAKAWSEPGASPGVVSVPAPQ